MTEGERTFWCRVCRSPRSAGEVLEVTRVRDGLTSYVCRPEVSARCFSTIAPASAERIALVAEVVAQ